MISFLSQALLMIKIFKVFLVILILPLLIYVFPQSPSFPQPPSDFVQSFEPADVETPLRRGYYTNLSRAEVISHYEKEFNWGFNVYTPRLNYPPEEAQAIIRDQTKSTFLEEIVHPLRESLFINGFEPLTEEYAIVKNGIRWRQRVVVRYVPSSVLIRMGVLFASMILSYFLILEYLNAKKTN
ncbi:MAG: hypothetical protein ACD_26C00034G0009 [uncultured bacterium]|nr:MAG: hypothetical protein ACD_26C00034G0009 [uncultured bacterium]